MVLFFGGKSSVLVNIWVNDVWVDGENSENWANYMREATAISLTPTHFQLSIYFLQNSFLGHPK